jgi:hypothetical protein
MRTYIFSGMDDRKTEWHYNIGAKNLREAIKIARMTCRRERLKYGNDCRRFK